MIFTISNNKVSDFNFSQIIKCLNNKLVPFFIKQGYHENVETEKTIILDITKPDRFYRINGTIVAANIVREIALHSN
jgi:hypothetical protein